MSILDLTGMSAKTQRPVLDPSVMRMLTCHRSYTEIIFHASIIDIFSILNLNRRAYTNLLLICDFMSPNTT